MHRGQRHKIIWTRHQEPSATLNESWDGVRIGAGVMGQDLSRRSLNDPSPPNTNYRLQNSPRLVHGHLRWRGPARLSRHPADAADHALRPVVLGQRNRRLTDEQVGTVAI